MTRMEQLENVRAAAEAVLIAREDQMLTSVEWERLANALASARTEPIDATMPAVRIVFEEEFMLALDGANHGIDCHELRLDDAAVPTADVVQRAAERQLDRWALVYKFDAADAKQRLVEYLDEIG